MKKKMEILAPAGNMAGVIAAINGGADAVYLGGKQFNARQRAENFDHEELSALIQLCHDHNIKVYLTLNTLIKDKELQAAADEAKNFWELGADALIVQDPGLVFLLRQFYPQIHLQTSTQASVFGLAGVKFFEGLGFDRVVLPREMSLNEVRRIKAATDIELKVFGHGALCYAYSGQCLLSSLIGGRSGNRGCCAQPCRKRYRLKTTRGQVLQSGYLMSMKDLNARQSVQEIEAAGVSALKIEGRMKGPAYIYAVSQAYSQTLRGEKPTCDDETLRQIFNRDFTNGCLMDDDERINPEIGRNKGSEIGRIADCRNGKVIVQLKSGVHLNKGDGLSFGIDAKKGMTLSVFLQKGRQAAIEGCEKLPRGLPVFRTLDRALQKELEEKASLSVQPTKLPIDIHLKIRVGQPLMAELRWSGGKMILISSEVPSLAQKTPVTEGMAKGQISKFGDSHYTLNHFSIETDGQAFMSKGSLNALRREIVHRLDEEFDARVKSERQLSKIIIDDILPPNETVSKKTPFLSLVIPESDCLTGEIEEWLKNDADEVVLSLLPDLKITEKILKRAKDAGKKTVCALPRIMNTDDEKRFIENWDHIRNFSVDCWYCPHYEGLQLLRDKALHLEAGSGLHLFNRAAAAALKNWGFSSAELSPELTGKAAAEIAAFTDLDCVFTVFGHQEMMVSKNCLLNCKEKHCEHCSDHQWYHLEDERGAVFPFYRDLYGNTRIFNGDKLFLKKNLSALKHMTKWRIKATTENAEEIRLVIDYYQKDQIEALRLPEYKGRYTTGNYKREVE